MINWEAQWEQFAPQFFEGKAHIDLQEFGVLPLLPGPGFGDFSHPTTRLMVEMMKSRVQDKSILDIGCGSGILSLAALKMGAKKAVGVDIDPDAILHARQNAKLNGFQRHATFKKTTNGIADLILINMITSEQLIAFSACKPQGREMIASGILYAKKEPYFALAASRGFIPKEEKREGEWAAFYLTREEGYDSSSF